MAWMLQGNPARFALRAYLQSPVLYWLVNRYQAEFALADHLFLWESGPRSLSELSTHNAIIPLCCDKQQRGMG